ncbi:MAG: B12-binding domain-containing radical SAM protein [Terriglobales bacterium]
MKILLVEPPYYTQYPPLGLLKLASLYKSQGHEVRLVRGFVLVTRFIPDEIKVTSLFTWAWKPVHEVVEFYRALFPRAKISLGGIYASLTPDHAATAGADEVVTGLVQEAEQFLPDYSLVPEWHRRRKASILFSHRGCVRKCSFCAVPKLEGSPFQVLRDNKIKRLIHPDHTRVILWDNNILGESDWRRVFAEIEDLGLEADFNQGLDARFITEESAAAIARIKLPTARLAYDFVGMRDVMERAVLLLKKHVPNRRFRHITCYVLFNYKDKPADLFERVRDLLGWGIAAYPMRYQPLSGQHAFAKDSYIAPSWTAEQLDMVAHARRVIGFGGAFPPYEGLYKKFRDAAAFDDAFALRDRRDRATDELEEFAWDEMGKDHQFQVNGHRADVSLVGDLRAVDAPA